MMSRPTTPASGSETALWPRHWGPNWLAIRLRHQYRTVWIPMAVVYRQARHWPPSTCSPWPTMGDKREPMRWVLVALPSIVPEIATRSLSSAVINAGSRVRDRVQFTAIRERSSIRRPIRFSGIDSRIRDRACTRLHDSCTLGSRLIRQCARIADLRWLTGRGRLAFCQRSPGGASVHDYANARRIH